MEIGNWVGSDQSPGRLIHIPSGLLFTHEIANYTEGFAYLWDELGGGRFELVFGRKKICQAAESLVLET